MHLKLILFVVFNFVILCQCGRQFRLGRGRHGNLGSPGNYAGEKLPNARWFKQKLDHFSRTDLRTWQQRYFVNDSFFDYNNPGPIFLMVGGEGAADPKWMVKGAWIEYAKRFKALCINVEHRYYGDSHPTKDLTTKNLQYLSSNQALADLANFITAMNEKLKLRYRAKWVAFGGSYPGSLAAWLRMKYPHLVSAAVSSSGPLLAKVNFMEYYEVVVEALREKTGGEDCVNQLRLAHKQIEALMHSDPVALGKEFRVCKPFSNATENDIRNFYTSIADDFADLVQYNEDNRIGKDERFRNITINSVCKMLMEESCDNFAYKRLAAFNSIMLDKANETCMDYSYSSLIDSYTKTGLNNNDGARQWLYQTCTEFGFYQTSPAEAEVFGNYFTLDFFIQQCQEVFGTKFDRAFIENGAKWSNEYYGGLDISVDHVVFVHGSVDPWHALGIIVTQDHNTPAIFIQGTAHCANMYPASKDDPPQLTEARLEIEQYLATWLEEL
ncbi:putative serine protease F56F10.1 [Battus philenor]|uniref:putative serine protease F56F10.1 n=1 Tax=Battus philenor TaxID=42288 RepID=UPI0035D05A04